MTHYASTPDTTLAIDTACHLAEQGYGVKVQRTAGVWQIWTEHEPVVGAQCIVCGHVQEPAVDRWQCPECDAWELHVYTLSAAP